VHKPDGDWLAGYLQGLGRRSPHRSDVDEPGRVPSGIVQPPIEAVEQRLDRSSPVSGISMWRWNLAQPADRTHGLREIDRKVVEFTVQLVSRGPGIRPVEPGQHGPSMWERILRFHRRGALLVC
jgi:hypothetical protein